MNIFDTTAQPCFVVDDDLLDFTLDDGESEVAVDSTIFKGGASSFSSSSSSSSSNPAAFGRRTQPHLFPEFAEEELEWLSNKDAFPSVETCFGILPDNPKLVSNGQTSVSVLGNSSNDTSIASCCTSLKVPTNYPVGVPTYYPVRARTRRRRRASFTDFPFPWLGRVNRKKRDFSVMSTPTPVVMKNGSTGIRCLHCLTDTTPQWRAGPMGPKTLCNACGVRYKSGRLLPEYRPANSPTFSRVLHSNSHKKVVEMRRQKQIGAGGGFIELNVAASTSGYRGG